MHCQITLCFAVFQGFPWKKVPLFIVAQIFGAFLACTIIYAQWYEGLQAYAAALRAAGEPIVSATGPAGLFVAVPLPTQEIKWVFVNEFFADSFVCFQFSLSFYPSRFLTLNDLLHPLSIPKDWSGNLGGNRRQQSFHEASICSLRHWLGLL